MSHPLAFQAVLHPTDLADRASPAFATALRIALTSTAELCIVHVVRGETVSWTELPGVRPMLERWGVLPHGSSPARVADLGLRVVKEQVRADGIVAGLLDAITRFGPDLVVTATHGRTGLDALLHGRVAEPVARAAHAPILVIPEGADGFVDRDSGAPALRKVLLPVARDPSHERALMAVRQLVASLEITPPELVALHVGDDPGPTVKSPDGWVVHHRHGTGAVVDGILDTARGEPADLIAMATQGHDTLLDALRGSTVERVLRAARRPVLVVPG